MTPGPYDEAAAAWAAGPAAVYARLAAALLDAAPVPLAGARLLDIGAGTGVVAGDALARGAAYAVASDVSAAMLARRPAGVGAVVADATRLPFASGAFGVAASAFCLSHLDDPGRAVAEARRVAEVYLASAFAPGPEHPAKTVVDEVMAGFGFEPPDWYVALKARSSVDDPDVLAQLAEDAGFTDITVLAREVDAGLSSPADVVRWRWGMAHLAPYVATLDAASRDRAWHACEEAVAGLLPVRIGMLALSAT